MSAIIARLLNSHPKWCGELTKTTRVTVMYVYNMIVMWMYNLNVYTCNYDSVRFIYARDVVYLDVY